MPKSQSNEFTRRVALASNEKAEPLPPAQRVPTFLQTVCGSALLINPAVPKAGECSSKHRVRLQTGATTPQ